MRRSIHVGLAGLCLAGLPFSEAAAVPPFAPGPCPDAAAIGERAFHETFPIDRMSVWTGTFGIEIRDGFSTGTFNFAFEDLFRAIAIGVIDGTADPSVSAPPDSVTAGDGETCAGITDDLVVETTGWEVMDTLHDDTGCFWSLDADGGDASVNVFEVEGEFLEQLRGEMDEFAEPLDGVDLPAYGVAEADEEYGIAEAFVFVDAGDSGLVVSILSEAPPWEPTLDMATTLALVAWDGVWSAERGTD